MCGIANATRFCGMDYLVRILFPHQLFALSILLAVILYGRISEWKGQMRPECHVPGSLVYALQQSLFPYVISLFDWTPSSFHTPLIQV